MRKYIFRRTGGKCVEACIFFGKIQILTDRTRHGKAVYNSYGICVSGKVGG